MRPDDFASLTRAVEALGAEVRAIRQAPPRLLERVEKLEAAVERLSKAVDVIAARELPAPLLASIQAVGVA